jgi:hypothetical protein
MREDNLAEFPPLMQAKSKEGQDHHSNVMEPMPQGALPIPAGLYSDASGPYFSEWRMGSAPGVCSVL